MCDHMSECWGVLYTLHRDVGVRSKKSVREGRVQEKEEFKNREPRLS